MCTAKGLIFVTIPHLSSQFKQVTGMTPKEFRELEKPGRTPLDAL